MTLRPNHLAAGTVLTLHAMASVGWLRPMCRAVGGFVFLCSGSFTRGADVLRPGLGEDLLRPFDFCGVLGVDRDEEVARLDLAFIAFGFDLGDAQTDQPAGDAAHGRSDRRTTQRGDNRSGGDEGADSRNGQGANPGDPAQRPAYDDARAGTGDSAFRGFGVLLVREIAGRPLVGKQHGDVVVGEVCGFELADNAISLLARGGDDEYRT